ncbi:zinc finger BED domain-containing protein 6-like [Pelobates fuscus]|uniref:zinc finger BED domain-containing protein 6-like n=1 Tax=Pelobates fuscus TaxID=191477 RepID=UPI002FE447D3
MSYETEDPSMACDSSLHSVFPRKHTGQTELADADDQYSKPSQSVHDVKTVQTPAGPSETVPEIEIKLESSDDEDGKNEACSFTQPGASARSLVSYPKKTVNIPDFGKGETVDKDFIRPLPDAHSLSHFPFRPMRKRKSTSEVWQFFYRDANNICRAICGICRMSVSRGKLGGNFGTTALKRHLENKHPMEWAQRESMRHQRGDEEEEEEPFEEEEEKDEPYEKTFNEHATLYSSQETSENSRMTCRTYEIIDSSDEGEDDDKVGGGINGVEIDEEIEIKRLRLLAREDNMRMNQFRGSTLDMRVTGKQSIGMVNIQLPSTSSSGYSGNSSVPAGTKKRKSTSAVWQFFYIDRTNICRAICTLCQLSVSRGKQGGHFGTSALMRHLEGKHTLEWAKGKLNKSKSNNIIEVEDEEEEEAEEQLDSVFTHQQVPFGHLSSSGFSEYSEVSTSLATAMPLEYDNGLVKRRSEISRDCAVGTLSSVQYQHIPAMTKDVSANGKYAPNHPKAQSWNKNITELMCGLALPYSFINSKAFLMFMQRADPLYSLPKKSFFSGRAVPQLYEAVCEQVAGELKRSECAQVHITAHMWNTDLPMNFLALTAHWVMFTSETQSSSTRKYAVLCVKRFPKQFNESKIQQELIHQVNLWLSPSALKPGFFICSGDFNLVHAIKGANYSYIPSFTHSLSILVMDFLQNNHFISSMLVAARKLCSHFIHSSRADKILSELQYQYSLPKHSLKLETVPHWTSTFYMLQRLLEQQRAVQEYLATYKLESGDLFLTSSHWNLMGSLVYLLQPFEMATREVNASDCSLSQVLPEVRYLHIFLRQIRGHFEGKGDANGVVLADSFALKLSRDYGVNEMFQMEEYVLSTLLDPRFKGRIEAILPPGSDIDHWKQVLVKKVKEVMISSASFYPPSRYSKRAAVPFKRDSDCDSELLMEKHYNLEENINTVSTWGSMAEPPLIQKDKSLIEHLESVGLMASESTGASLSTESHSACVMVEKYLQDNKTIGAKEDPLGYWEKRKWLWPALTKLAIMYLTCPPSSIFAERVFKSPRGFVDTQCSLEVVEGIEHIYFLKANLENFPHYTPPPLISSSDNEMEQSDNEDGF